jgi:hypothetical protein
LSLEYELTYADSIEEGTALVERIRGEQVRGTLRPVGFDTEFYGVEIGKHSVLARAKCHFASLAWDFRGSPLHPRGFTIPHAAVVSRKVVTECEPFRAWVKEQKLLAHNAPVDVHVFKNEGIEVEDVVNTLTMARWTWPGRARAQYGGGGFGLDALSKDVLGEGKLDKFSELFTELVPVFKEKRVRFSECACKEPGCRKRSAGHTKFKGVNVEQEEVWEERPVPLELVVPGHPLFERALKYAAQDAVLAFGLYQIMQRTLENQIRTVPWLVSATITQDSQSSLGEKTRSSGMPSLSIGAS